MSTHNAAIAEKSKCENTDCGHALSMHNDLGYCRSRTTPDRSGECICDGTSRYGRWPVKQGGDQ